MGVTINQVFYATTRLWLTSDRSRIVPEGDPKAAFLLAGVGGVVSRADVERYGLTEDAPDTGPLSAEPKEEPVETKAPKAPAKKR